MFGVRKALVLSTLILSTFASPCHHKESETTNWEKFSALLDTVDEISLHRVLHALSPKFKDGVFSKDRTAVEHVHSENPIVASKIVHIAKRQGSNSTITSTPPTTTTQPSSVSSSISSVISSELSSQITATTIPPPTTVYVAPPAPTSATAIQTESGAVVYSTYGGGVVTLTSSPVGVTFSQETSTQLYYSTLDNGNIETSTAVVVVNAPKTQTAAVTGAAGAATTTGGTGLQNAGVKTFISGAAATFAGLVALIIYI